MTWLFFIPIAILNGVLREWFYKSFVGDLTAHQISTVVAIIAFTSFSYYMLHGFGHYVDKISWEELLAEYNIFKGRLWGLFLLTEFLSPVFIKFLVNSIR